MQAYQWNPNRGVGHFLLLIERHTEMDIPSASPVETAEGNLY